MIWTRFVRQPQTLWIRRAAFQIHLWAGVIVGFYILAISASGSVLVYRNELYERFAPQPLFVPVSGPRLSAEQLEAAALRAYPGYEVTKVWERTKPGEASEVDLARGRTTRMRLFDPYTGRDLGNSARPAVMSTPPARYRSSCSRSPARLSGGPASGTGAAV
jgi:uncharacterized iron-regulated membrane protein